MTSPTQRTLAYLRGHGYVAQVVERWCPYSRRRHDLFGIGDVLALAPAEMLLVQCTTASNAAARASKALAAPGLFRWLQAGGLFEVWSWAKRGPRGKAKRWSVVRRPILLSHLPPLP